MKNLISRLEKKGWSKNEISRAVDIIHNAKQVRTNETRFFERRIYWILLVIIIAANFAIPVALLPVLMVLKGIALYSTIIILGVSLGFLFELVIRSIEHLERHHHIWLAVMIPATALVSFFFISRISNDMEKIFALKNAHNPFLLAFAYASSLVLPYILYRFVLKIEYYSS